MDDASSLAERTAQGGMGVPEGLSPAPGRPRAGPRGRTPARADPREPPPSDRRPATDKDIPPDDPLLAVVGQPRAGL